MPRVKHIHKYKKVTFESGYVVLNCVLGCPHYIRREVAVGRMALCWRCERPFVLNESASQMAKPHCQRQDCSKTRKALSNEDRVRLKEKGINPDEFDNLRQSVEYTSLARRNVSPDRLTIGGTHILKILRSTPTHSMERQLLLSRLWKHGIDASEFDRVVAVLIEQGKIKFENLSGKTNYKSTVEEETTPTGLH